MLYDDDGDTGGCEERSALPLAVISARNFLTEILAIEAPSTEVGRVSTDFSHPSSLPSNGTVNRIRDETKRGNKAYSGRMNFVVTQLQETSMNLGQFLSPYPPVAVTYDSPSLILR